MSAPWQAFGSIRRDGRAVAVGRVSVADDLGVLTAVEVDAAYHRQGAGHRHHRRASRRGRGPGRNQDPAPGRDRQRPGPRALPAVRLPGLAPVPLHDGSVRRHAPAAHPPTTTGFSLPWCDGDPCPERIFPLARRAGRGCPGRYQRDVGASRRAQARCPPGLDGVSRARRRPVRDKRARYRRRRAARVRAASRLRRRAAPPRPVRGRPAEPRAVRPRRRPIPSSS